MKEIKFRLRVGKKIVGYEKWYGGSFGEVLTANPCWLYSKEGEKWYPNYIYHKQKDQYTGLKDKNGKEIYEGDVVVKNEYPFYSEGLRNYVGIIEWFDEDLCWSYSILAISDRVRGCACGSSLNKNDKFEIIDNIYENPELKE